MIMVSCHSELTIRNISSCFIGPGKRSSVLHKQMYGVQNKSFHEADMESRFRINDGSVSWSSPMFMDVFYGIRLLNFCWTTSPCWRWESSTTQPVPGCPPVGPAPPKVPEWGELLTPKVLGFCGKLFGSKTGKKKNYKNSKWLSLANPDHSFLVSFFVLKPVKTSSSNPEPSAGYFLNFGMATGQPSQLVECFDASLFLVGIFSIDHP